MNAVVTPGAAVRAKPGPATLAARLRLLACVGGGTATCSFGALREESLPHDVQ
jgi:hypothetical protein